MKERPCECRKNSLGCENDFQSTEHSLFKKNASLREIGKALAKENSQVYLYIVKTADKSPDQKLRHWGCGPNLQGDRITLCTCKHLLRTYRESDHWRNTWIAGFTGAKVDKEENYLFYLMKVQFAFDSHAALWRSGEISQKVLKIKSTRNNPFGDIYEPKNVKTAKTFSTSSYYKSCNGHRHSKRFEKDIDYEKNGRRSSLLVGNPKSCFIWETPSIRLKNIKLHRGDRKLEINELMESLE